MVNKMVDKPKIHQVGLDPNAYLLLLSVREELKERGIASPTFSDAVRELYRKAKEAKE